MLVLPQRPSTTPQPIAAALGSSANSADDTLSFQSVADAANAGVSTDTADAAPALAYPFEPLSVDTDALAVVCFTRHLVPRAALATATPGYLPMSAGAAGGEGELGGPLSELLQSVDFVVSETRMRARALGAAGVVFEEEAGGAYEALLDAAGDVSLKRAAHGAPALAHMPAACAHMLRSVHALLDGPAEATVGARFGGGADGDDRNGEIRGGSSRAEAATKGNTGALPQSPAGLSLVTDKTDNYPLRSGVN